MSHREFLLPRLNLIDEHKDNFCRRKLQKKKKMCSSFWQNEIFAEFEYNLSTCGPKCKYHIQFFPKNQRMKCLPPSLQRRLCTLSIAMTSQTEVRNTQR
jgi:hypothetical protein